MPSTKCWPRNSEVKLDCKVMNGGESLYSVSMNCNIIKLFYSVHNIIQFDFLLQNFV